MACVDRSQTCGYGSCQNGQCVCTGEWTGDACRTNPAASTAGGVILSIALLGFVLYNTAWAFRETHKAVAAYRAKKPNKPLNAAMITGIVGCATCLAVVLETMYALWNFYYDANEALARIGLGFLRCSTFGICYLWGTATHPHRQEMYRRVFSTLGIVLFILDIIVLAVDWNRQSLYDNPLLLLVILPATLLCLAVLPTAFGIPLYKKLRQADKFRADVNMEPLPYTSKVRRIVTKLIGSGLLLFVSVLGFSAFELIAQGGMAYLIAVAVFEMSYIMTAVAVVQFIVVPDPPKDLATRDVETPKPTRKRSAGAGTAK